MQLLTWKLYLITDTNISYRPRLANFPHYLPGINYLKKYGEEVFVDGRVEVHAAPLNTISVDTVDIVVISNYMSLFALPFFTENPSFRGSIYTTAPVLELGRLVTLEFIDFVECDDRNSVGNEWKDPRIFTAFPNRPTSDPREWTPFYTREQFEKVISRVDVVSFRDPVNLHGIMKITAYSSGYSIGSCNWIIHTETEKIAYVAASSSRSSHMKAADWDQFLGCDSLILTSISRFPDLNPESSVYGVCAVAIDTLKKNGSVLMPVCPTGVIYDLLEVLSNQMDQQNVSQDVPIYFISPIAKETLAFSSISMEWLSEKKQSAFYVPEQAFAHGQMMQNGRLKVYSTSHGPFSRQMRTPCLIFCGHPSLRLGDAIHFLEMWGPDSRNAIIMTDPDYPLGDVYGPYRTLAIRAFFYPIDTRLDYTQLTSSIIPDLSPKLLVTPDVYAKPPVTCPHRIDCTINYEPRMVFRYGDTLTISSILKRKRVSITPEQFPKTTFHSLKGSNGLGMASLEGYLSAFDNTYVLSPNPLTSRSTTQLLPSNRPKFVGETDIDTLLKRLKEIDPETKIVDVKQGKMIIMPGMKSEVHMLDDGGRTRILCESAEGRQKLFKAVACSLKGLCTP